MKKTVLVSALFSLALIGSLCAEHYQIYLLGGQSNGNGRADAAQLSPPLSLEQTDVRLYYLNDQDENSVLPEEQWINLAPGSGHGGTPKAAVEFGPEVSFGRAMADAKPTENIAIIKYTYGGSNLYSQWSATGARYLTFVSTVQDALAALTTAGDTYVLRGMLWQQGEADSNNLSTADAYEANLTDLIARVRTDLNGGAEFPFVIGSLSDSQYVGNAITTPGTGSYKVRQAQEAVAAANPTVGIAISDGFDVYADDIIHFNHSGQVALGQGHATQMLALEATSLIHHWPFDGDADDAASTHNGTTVGNASYTTGSGGKFGEAVSLDGAGDYIDVAQSSLPASDFTLTAWIYRETAGDYMYVAGTQNSGDNGAFLRAEPATGANTANNALFANLLPPSSSQRVWGGTIPLNTWTHVAMTVSSTAGLEIFINGTSEGTDVTAVGHTVFGNFRIGARPDGSSNYFDGLIDDVAIFDGVLTSTQLANVIAQGAANFDFVPDNDPPEVVMFTPGDAEIAVAIDTELVITFDEFIQAGPSGDIVIKKSNGNLFETIPIGDTRVTISEDLVKINPSADLADSTTYYVEIDASAIDDLAGNSFAGFTGDGTWRFTTIVPPSPDLLFSDDFSSAGSGYGFAAATSWSAGTIAGGEIEVSASTGNEAAFRDLASDITIASADFWLVANMTWTGTKPLDESFFGITFFEGTNPDLYIGANTGATDWLFLIPGGSTAASTVGITSSLTQVVMHITGTQIDMWIDPADTSSAGALGDADATFDNSPSLITSQAQWDRLRIVAGVNGGSPGTSSVTVDNIRAATTFVEAIPQPTFSSWIGGFDVGGETAFTDDPDADGIGNGLENYFGTHPGEFSQGAVVVSGTPTGNTFTFAHPLNATPASDISASYRWSKDLASFHGDALEFEDTTVTFNQETSVVDGIVTVTATITGTPIDKLFVVIQVTQP